MTYPAADSSASPVPGTAPAPGIQDPAGGARNLSAAPPAGQSTPPRTFTVALPAGLELLNLNDRLHHMELYRRSQALKKAAWAVTLQAKVPRLERAWIAVEYQPPPDWRRRDSDNPVIAAKACIDGIVAAGVLPDDECPKYVTGIWCTIGEPYPRGRLVLHITEVLPGGEAG